MSFRQEPQETPPPASVAKAIADAEALRKSERFADAIAVLEVRQKEMGERISEEEKRALLITVSKVYFFWARFAVKGQNWKAVIEYNQAAYQIDRIYRQRGSADDLFNIAAAYNRLEDSLKSLEYYNRALSIYHQVGAKEREASALFSIGIVNFKLKRFRDALYSFQNCLPIWKAIDKKPTIAEVLFNIASSHAELRESSEAIMHFGLALEIWQQIGDKPSEAMALTSLGDSHKRLGEPSKVLDFYSQALPIQKQLMDRAGEADSLATIGSCYISLGVPSKALQFHFQALSMFQKLMNNKGEAQCLNSIGVIYLELNVPSKALKFFNQAINIQRDIDNKQGQANSVTNKGNLFLMLGEFTKAIEQYQSALLLWKQTDNSSGESAALANIGAAYKKLGYNSIALEFYNKSLGISTHTGDLDRQAVSLENIGSYYFSINDKANAIEFYNRALLIHRRIGQKKGEASTLSHLGNLHSAQGEKTRALENHHKAISLQMQIEDKRGQAQTLNNLGHFYESIGENEVAIFFVKKSSGILQSLRVASQDADRQSQQTFTKEVQSVYQGLARLLARKNRYPEAQQIYLLLARQNAREAGAALQPFLPNLTPVEATIAAEYDRLGGDLGNIGRQLTPLQQVNEPTQEQAATRDRLETQIKVAQDSFTSFLNALPERFQNAPPQEIEYPQLVPEFHRAFQTLKTQSGQSNATLLTMLCDDRIAYLLVKNGKTVLKEKLIQRADLEKTIGKFRVALTATNTMGKPLYDPMPLARQLYTILVKPIEKDIEGCQHVFWALDGKLRYIPLAALHDGKKYLVEKPQRHTLLIAESVETLAKKPMATPKLLACATSKAHKTDDYSFEALPGVEKELAAIKPTRALPDKAFTRASFLSGLKGRYPIVHLATHFALKPGNLYNSFLLLGDGAPLRLSEINDLPDDLFSGVDLLTLSACETGSGTATENGAELESFGYLAQRKGAAAVLSTLWPVNDASTAALMARFYGSLGKVGPGGKAEALRLAQVALLIGKEKPTLFQRSPQSGYTPGKVDTPAFKWDPKAPCAHPYYWAPFTLLGNPR